MGEIQRVVKGLLAQGARLPKHAHALREGHAVLRRRDERDRAERRPLPGAGRIYGYFVQHHADRIRQDIGVDPSQVQLDTKGLKASLGLEAGVESITPAELLKRRDTIRERLEKEANRA